ncbi:glutathione peroxidase [Luteimonas abyssi]|uniref:glutathione peroxidase n=1 Tax=Luteimonas abyssi TaxID=1247514 RepID=UPI000737CF0E|nr:glutathione peroxidase [Luteimonas abyssi]
MTTLSDFEADTLDGRRVALSAYAGQVVLIVNVASACGFTPQYTGLQALWTRYRDRGFAVLGFPCNQFGGQEPGGADEIREFCDTRFRVDFPMFDKVDVNGPAAAPLWQWLRGERRGLLGTSAIKWNFTKFLVGRDGRVLDRFGPARKPGQLETAIEAALKAVPG